MTVFNAVIFFSNTLSFPSPIKKLTISNDVLNANNDIPINVAIAAPGKIKTLIAVKPAKIVPTTTINPANNIAPHTASNPNS